MADDDNNLNDNMDAADNLGGGGSQKAGAIPEFVVLILKILAAGIGVVLVSAAVFFIMFGIFQGDSPRQTMAEASPAYNSKPEPLEWWGVPLGQIKGSTSDRPSKSWVLEPMLGFSTADTVKITTELNSRIPQLIDLIRRTLSRKLGDELRNEDRLKSELMIQINDILSSGQIKEISFKQFVVIEGL